MRRNGEFPNPNEKRSKNRSSLPDTEFVILQALRFLGRESDEAQRFFGWTGLDAASLRAATVDPGFILGLLDYFAENLISLERFCTGSGIEPHDLIRLHESLKTRGLSAHDEV